MEKVLIVIWLASLVASVVSFSLLPLAGVSVILLVVASIFGQRDAY